MRMLVEMGYNVEVDKDWPIWGAAAGILVGGKSLEEIGEGGGARYNGAMDSRAGSGTASGY
jgi:gamma-glutamyltranspeptidase/glutathione hydrolase